MGRWNTLQLSQDDPNVATLTLARPAQRNALNLQLAEELVACLAELRQRKDLRVLVLTGAGPAFCAGGDLKERLEAGPAYAQRQRDCALRAIDLLEQLPCPVLAMINGPAIAGGLEIALGCDIRIASEEASFGLPEARAAGGFPGAGGPVRLTRMIGRGRASLMVFSARLFSAREAFELGFIERVVAPQRLRDDTYALARQIAANSPRAIRGAKQLISHADDMDMASAAALSRALRDPLDLSPDFQEAVQAWRDKRDPQFQRDSHE